MGPTWSPPRALMHPTKGPGNSHGALGVLQEGPQRGYIKPTGLNIAPPGSSWAPLGYRIQDTEVRERSALGRHGRGRWLEGGKGCARQESVELSSCGTGLAPPDASHLVVRSSPLQTRLILRYGARPARRVSGVPHLEGRGGGGKGDEGSRSDDEEGEEGSKSEERGSRAGQS